MKKIFVALAVSIFTFPALIKAQVPFFIEGKINTDSVLHGKITIISKGIKRDLDSVEIVNNSYHLTGTMDRPGRMVSVVWCDGPIGDRIKRTGTVAETGVFQFFLSPGKIKIEHKLPFKNASVSGSTMEDDYQLVRKNIAGNSQNVNTAIINYIGNHPNSWLSFSLLQDRSRSFGPKLTDSLYNLLDLAIKKNDEVMVFAKQLSNSNAVKVGNFAPDFTLGDPNGKPITLSSYKGKYVLVDFWASWCAPCRAENPTVKGLYNKYQEKGFNVLGISLDLESSKQAWLDAIKKDGLTWSQVSDLKGFESKVAVLYGVHAIPANFFIDPSGKIIATNLRGYDLEKKVNELFQ